MEIGRGAEHGHTAWVSVQMRACSSSMQAVLAGNVHVLETDLDSSLAAQGAVEVQRTACNSSQTVACAEEQDSAPEVLHAHVD